MRGLSAAYDAAVAAIDAANSADPNMVAVRGHQAPLAMAHGQLAAEWVARLAPGADELLLLAARAHHLRRWEVPRDSYPPGRGGYLRWRRDQKVRHAADVGRLMAGSGFDAARIARVQQLVRRDPVDGSQIVEDAACLVFVETQLGAVADRLDHDHLVGVIRKTAAKMSDAALALVAAIPVGERERALLAEAFGSPDTA